MSDASETTTRVEPALLSPGQRILLAGRELRHWPARRWLIAAGIAAAASTVLIAAGGLAGSADAAAAAAWWALPAALVGSALAALVIASYIDTPIGADATLCDTRWPALGLIGLYLATELRSLEPVLTGAVRPVVALAAITLLVWALRARLVKENHATAAPGADSEAQPGEVCTSCRPLFARSARPAASAVPTPESHPRPPARRNP